MRSNTAEIKLILVLQHKINFVNNSTQTFITNNFNFNKPLTIREVPNADIFTVSTPTKNFLASISVVMKSGGRATRDWIQRGRMPGP